MSELQAALDTWLRHNNDKTARTNDPWPRRRKDALTMIGDRLRNIREQRKLSQREVEEKTGLLRCYISRVENGHTVPALATIEKLARAFDLPLYQIFYEGEQTPKSFVVSPDKNSRVAWASSRKAARFLHRFQSLLVKMDERDRRLLIEFAHITTLRKKSDSKTPKLEMTRSGAKNTPSTL